jgi:CRISPR-associated endonuclease/helicase Cas3
VFWRDLSKQDPGDQSPPLRDELCAVSITQARALLDGKRSAWRLDPQSHRRSTGKPMPGTGKPMPDWTRFRGRPWPGIVVMLDAAEGGYLPATGLLPESRAPVPTVPPPPEADPESDPDDAIDGDGDTRKRVPVLLTDHLNHVADHAAALAASLGLPADLARAVELAARWHDVGKAHTAFQARLPKPADQSDAVLAKATGYDRRKGRPYFRHELASALAFMTHHRDTPGPLDDLVAYLIAAHHGKVRLSLRAVPAESADAGITRFARGVWEGDPLGAVDLGNGDVMPPATLSLAVMELGEGPMGPSWTERTRKLLNAHGPFRLAWLESLVRIADWRASEEEQRRGQEGDHD